jgi:hypothetical protein
LDKSELAVGDSTALEIIFSTKAYAQRVTKRPRIVTNEGQPDKSVAVIADVLQRPDSTYPVIIRPYKLDISQFGEKVRDRMKFTISNVSDKEVQINLIAGLPKHAEISLPKKIGAGQSGSGEVRLLPAALEQSFEKSFTFEVKADSSVRFTVPIKRSVKKAEVDTAKTATTPPSTGQ